MKRAVLPIATILAISLAIGTYVWKEERKEVPINNILEETSSINEIPQNIIENINVNDNKAVAEDSYPTHSNIMATLFWVGEKADNSNGYIANLASYWDEYWQESYGGVDDPNYRCGFYPCSFKPKENPFYIALPYGEYDSEGKIKNNSEKIYWVKEIKEGEELLKNRWIMVRSGENICYGQWQDVGPFETDDIDYVFGKNKPKNTYGVSAGIDLSPAIWTCLKLKTNTEISWKFIDEKNVPNGPWKETITKSGTTY